MFLLYYTDNHHSEKSRDLIGVFSSKEKAINGAWITCEDFDVPFTKRDRLMLKTKNLTQGIKDDFEFLIERAQLDEIII